VIVRTFDGLQALTTPAPTWHMSGSSGGSVNLYDYRHTYFEIFRTQPNVRICVEFLARNIADVAPQAFRRVSDTDRVRLADHDLITWLGKPNPATVRFRLIEDLIHDLGIYYRAFWLKVRYVGADGRDAIGLVRLPPDETRAMPEGALLPQFFRWTVNGRDRDFAPSEIVSFAGYKGGISPLETLRRILAEEAAAGEQREGFWRNGSRISGVITRPKEVKRYTKEQAQEWREGYQAVYAGGANAEKTLLLQEGETFTPTSFSAKESEYTAGGKLRREICAAVYQIPQPFVGILEHATFSNIKEQHKNLYQDCLGPWFEWLRQEIHRQLLVECDDQADVYVEFNIDKKLAGTPEDRANSMQVSIGRPWRTVNEGRALDNLPRIDDPELDTVAPQQGGPAAGAAPDPDAAPVPPTPTPTASVDVAPVIQAAQARQQARLQKLPITDRAAAFDLDRWNTELTADLTPLLGADAAAGLANTWNLDTLARLEADAQRARVDALERRPVHPAPASITA
jgi:HK97 family phage portal protein